MGSCSFLLQSEFDHIMPVKRTALSEYCFDPKVMISRCEPKTLTLSVDCPPGKDSAGPSDVLFCVVPLPEGEEIE